MSTLAVFVHGLGANEHAFWGTTAQALRDSVALRPDTEVRFWGYETTGKPRPIQRLLGPLGAGSPLESVDSLGEHLWSKLRLWFREDEYESVRLLGHSMGGLVVAAAVGRALDENRSNDQGLIEALSGVAFVATPLGGAGLTNRTGPLFELFGRNVQVADLMPGSPSRARLVDRFIDKAMREKRVVLTVFRASNDQVVEEFEVDQPLVDDASIKFRKEVLTGNHSGCVQNLQADDENLRMLVHWARGRLTASDITNRGKSGNPTSVFVSRPSTLTERQGAFYDALANLLTSLGLRARTLGLTDAPKQEGGMYDVLELLRQCHGAIILGLSQIQVENATFKGGTESARTEGPCEFVTPWNHMEACMAFAHDVPLLIVRESSVYDDGVFDRGCLRLTTYETDLSPSSLEGRFETALRSWLDQVALRASEFI